MSRGSTRADHAAQSAPVVSHQNLVQRSDSADHRAERSAPPIVHDVLREPGEPLDAATRAFFEPRLDHDFSRVRVHTGARAVESTDVVNARAYTVGRDIVFDSGEYQPHAIAGRQLLAHELSHVAEQGDQPALQRAGKPASPPFDFDGSRIAALIRQELSKVTIQLQGEEPQPRVNPEDVIRMLSTSKRFLAIAAAVEREYFPRKGRPTKTPALNFLFHENPEIGTEFRSRQSRIDVEVTSPAEVVAGVVHELVHASHGDPVPTSTRGAGEVTRSEEAFIAEEASTRASETAIMAEIATSPEWQELTRSPAPEPTPAGLEDVRNSFRSGIPRLTYQESNIIEQERDRARVAGFDEALALRVARAFKPIAFASTESLSEFTISPEQDASWRSMAKQSQPVEPPSFEEAKACVQTYLPKVRRTREIPSLPNPACEMILDAAVRYDDQSDEMILNLLKRLGERAHFRRQGISEGQDYVALIDGVNPGQRASAKVFVEWLMVAERMSDEWLALGAKEPDAATRRKHLDFLSARIGAPLKGISRP